MQAVPIKIGFTGTRHGMAPHQLEAVRRVLESPLLEVVEVHHGSCVGADKEFHDLCVELGLKIHSHPCTLKNYRADCTHGTAVIYPEKRPFVRNYDIAKASDVVLAAPDRDLRGDGGGGTWNTIAQCKTNGWAVAQLLRSRAGGIFTQGRDEGVLSRPLTRVLIQALTA